MNSVRGRKEASDTNTVGIGEISKRLGGIEHSTPAVMERSDVAGDQDRDRVVFVGADDGMLHAFYAGVWTPVVNADGSKAMYERRWHRQGDLGLHTSVASGVFAEPDLH